MQAFGIPNATKVIAKWGLYYVQRADLERVFRLKPMHEERLDEGLTWEYEMILRKAQCLDCRDGALVRLIYTLQRTKCSDPRDYIYASYTWSVFRLWCQVSSAPYHCGHLRAKVDWQRRGCEPQNYRISEDE